MRLRKLAPLLALVVCLQACSSTQNPAPAPTAPPHPTGDAVDPSGYRAADSGEGGRVLYPGTTVKMRSQRIAGTLRGQLVSLDASNVVVRDPSEPEPTSVPVNSVLEFEVLVASGPSRGKGFRTGALIGAAVGLVVGLILFSGGDADVPDTVVPGSAAAFGLLGGLVGTALPPPTSEKWESVPPHELRAIARGAGATRSSPDPAPSR